MMLKHYFLIFLIKFLWIYGGGSQPVQESLRIQRVEFQSFNLQSILRWLPGSVFTPNNTVYFVQYKMYGKKEWTNKEECWGIYEVFCDLTNETSDIEEPYYGRVKASSAHVHTPWSMTKRFSPWLETKIGPPSISVIQSDRSIQLILHAPNSPYKDRKGRNKSLKDYYDLIYQVFLINNSQDMKQKVYEGTNDTVEIDIIPGSNYCIAAVMYLFELDRSSEGAKICTFKTQGNV